MTAANQRQLDDVEQLSPNYEISEIKACKDHPHICGKEAACRTFADNTSKCVCPHDLSPPTPDLRCPNRLTGKATQLSFRKNLTTEDKQFYIKIARHNNWRLKDREGPRDDD